MTLLERLRDAWTRATTRERALIGIATIVVVVGLGHALVGQPLQRDLSANDRALNDARAREARSRQAAAEIAGLAREARAPRTPDLRVATERVVASTGIRGEVTALDARDGRVRLTFAAIDFAALNALIEQLGREEQLFPVEALLAARVEPGTVRAELSLARPGAP